MDARQIIIRPIVSEKSYRAIDTNRYAFEVDKRANKHQIRHAIEELYKVRVVEVATQRRKGKVRRTRYGYHTTPEIKKAIVKVHPDDRIELF